MVSVMLKPTFCIVLKNGIERLFYAAYKSFECKKNYLWMSGFASILSEHCYK